MSWKAIKLLLLLLLLFLLSLKSSLSLSFLFLVLLICSDPAAGASAALALAQPLVQAVTTAPAISHPAQALAAASSLTSQELLSTRRRRVPLAQALAQAATQALEQAQAMTVATQDLGLATQGMGLATQDLGLETLGPALDTTWAEMLLQVSKLPCCSLCCSLCVDVSPLLQLISQSAHDSSSSRAYLLGLQC